jgi:myo-inositol 2-dehydrogenase / D-chiro-inositol 1-dehydrogenase
MTQNTKTKIAVIGAGRIGRMHIEHLATRIPQADLVAIADVNLEAAQAVAAEFGVPTAVADYRDILENPEVEAVLVCSATNTHAQISREAASAGKHVFCEKPIDFKLKRIDETLAVIERAGVKFQVGFNRRFDQSFRRVRETVASGQIGEPHILRITSRDPEPPPVSYIKVSGGIFLDMTIHDFDMARYLLGSEVVEVYATGGVMVEPEIGEAGDIDTAVITLKFENGAIGTIDNSRKAVYGYDQRVEVFGSEGMATAANPQADMHTLSNSAGFHTPVLPHFFIERYKEAYITELREFIASIQNDTPPLVTGVDGRIPVVMGLAALKSYRENRPVQLGEIEEGVE